MPIHQMPPRCYIVANGYLRPPQTALTLWNDTIDSDQTGPHVMIGGPGIAKMLDRYPTSADDTRKPFIMFGGTPYEYLILQVQ